MQRQHGELQARVGNVTREFEAFVALVRRLVASLPALHDGASMVAPRPLPGTIADDEDDEAASDGASLDALSTGLGLGSTRHATEGKHLFKPSKMKNALVLAHVPTNLAVHASEVRFTPGTAGGTSGGGTRGPPLKIRSLFGTTFGAPSAHALGWKHGGLRSLLVALDKCIERNGRPGHGHQSPAAK